MGFEPEPSKEGSWMMAQNGLVVAGVDVAKGKVDACIRALAPFVSAPLTAHGKPALPPGFAPDAARVHRIPRPTSVTIAKRPSEGARRREL
jgi:hypothetical protein